jgi:lipopolysaccharide biosynthesis glycosyltransferase
MNASHPIVYIADAAYLHLLPANFDQISRYAASGQLVYVVTTSKTIPIELSTTAKKYPNLQVIFKQVDFQDYLDEIEIPQETHVTKIALLKFFLPEILIEDIVVYLDVDTLICAPLTDLLAYNPGYLLGAVEEIGTNAYLRSATNSYFNSGVLVMSLKKIKALGLYKNLNQRIARQVVAPDNVDQDLFNQIYEGLVDFLPQKYNVFICNHNSASLGTFVKFPTIIHFVGQDKPWVYPKKSKYSKLWIESFANATKPNPSAEQVSILNSNRGSLNIRQFTTLLKKFQAKSISKIKERMPKVVKGFLRRFV